MDESPSPNSQNVEDEPPIAVEADGAAEPTPVVFEELSEPAPDEQASELHERVTRAEHRADELTALLRRQSELTEELHKDNRRLRDGEIQDAIAPLLRGLARVVDDLDRIRAARPDDEDLTHIDSRVRDVLHDVGASTLHPQAGEPFDPRQHHATGSTPTPEPEQDRTVALVRRDGLVVDGRVLRPADVVVYRLQAPPKAEAATGAAGAAGQEKAE